MGIRWSQLWSGDRHGTDTKGQASDGTGTSGNFAKYNSNGSLTDGAVPPATKASVSHFFLTAYDAVTGLFTAAQPTEADIVNLVSDLALLAPKASPTFTGDPKAPTPSPGDNDTSIATTAFVAAAIAAAGGGTWIEEVPSGTLDGSNPTFTLSHTPIAGTLDLQCNIAQREGTDFTISTNTITMTVAPKFTDTGWFFARYEY